MLIKTHGRLNRFSFIVHTRATHFLHAQKCVGYCRVCVAGVSKNTAAVSAVFLELSECVDGTGLLELLAVEVLTVKEIVTQAVFLRSQPDGVTTVVIFCIVVDSDTDPVTKVYQPTRNGRSSYLLLFHCWRVTLQ